MSKSEEVMLETKEEKQVRAKRHAKRVGKVDNDSKTLKMFSVKMMFAERLIEIMQQELNDTKGMSGDEMKEYRAIVEGARSSMDDLVESYVENQRKIAEKEKNALQQRINEMEEQLKTIPKRRK